MKTPLPLTFLVACIAGFACTSARGQASFTPLGALPGHQVSIATGVSADGSTVIGYSGMLEAQDSFRWTAGGGMVSLGGPPPNLATAVNGDGSVIVGTKSTSTASEAFRWSSTGGFQYLPRPTTSQWHSAWGVSADGERIIGMSGGLPVPARGCRWDSFVPTMLPLLAGHGGGQARGISFDGDTVVGFAGFASPPEAFRWTSEAGTTSLGFPAGSNATQALAVSGDGAVIAGVASTGAFRWTAAAGFTIIDPVEGNTACLPVAVSADGSVIVGVCPDSHEAVMWGPSMQPRPLLEVLTVDHGLNLDGWMLLAATGISADGRTIVGNGVHKSGLNGGFVARLGAPVCFANCDGSTSAPVLNVADFTCFLQRFAAGDPYANCDGSSGEPVLNIADFTCFLQRFAAGCP